MNDKECCVASNENPLNQNYWDVQYKNKTTGKKARIILGVRSKKSI